MAKAKKRGKVLKQRSSRTIKAKIIDTSLVPQDTQAVAAPRQRKEAVPLRTPGLTGLKRWGGYVHDEWHPKLRGKKAIKTYREMSDNDAVLGSVGYSMRSYIEQASRDIEPKDDSPLAEQIAEHVRTCIDDMSMTPHEFISDVTSMIWAGYSIHGIYYKIRRGPDAPIPELRSDFNDGGVGWRKLPIRDQETIEEWQFQEDGGINGAIQMPPPDYRRIELPIDQHLLFRTVSNKNNPEGRSLYRNAWRSWWFLKRIQELEAIGVERDMAGVMVFYMPFEYLANDASSEQQQTVADFRKVVERARRGEHEGLVFPTDEDEDGKTGFKLELLQSGGRRPMDVDAIIKRLESRIALSVLGEAVLLGMQGNVGSWSLASSKTHMFAVGVKSVMVSIEDVFNRFAIPRLVRYNGWPVELSPTLKFGDIESDESGELVTSLSTATTSGLITPDPEIEKYLRIRMGLPLGEEISFGQLQDAAGELAENETDEAAAAAGEVAAQDVIPIEQQQDTPTASIGVDEAAEITGVNRNIIMGALRRGQLPGARVGGQWRILRDDLREYLRGQKAA
jgi:excisionase family DNA binding protein